MEPNTPPLEEQPAAQDVQFLEDQIFAFNIGATGVSDGRLIAFFMRDTQSAIVAGLHGWTWGGCLEIRYLWVREDLRGRGFGSQLLTAAEQEALRRGCRQALLDTHSFQAPGFYQKQGYTIYAELDDYPEGHKKCFLRKTL